MDDFAKEIAKALSEYTDEVTEGLQEAQKEIATNTAKTLKRTSPKLTGEYAKGWSKKKIRGGGYVIYNKNAPQITHLLEDGHAKRGGGRVSGITHIRPAEEEAIEEYINKAEKVIRG